MSLKTTLEEIKKVKPHAEENLEGAEVATLNARRGRKANAVETLKRLKRDYKRDMLENAVFLVAVGSGRDEFASIVSTENKWFSANPEVFYQDLAKRVPGALYLGKTGISDIFEVVGRHLEDKMNELDLIEYNQLIFKAQYAQKINSQEELTTLLKRAINNQIGSEIVAIQAVDSLVDEAIERGHSDAITPIVLSTGDEDLALELIRDFRISGQPAQLVGVGEISQKLKIDGIMVLEDTTKKSIKSVLSSMKKLVSRK